MKKRRLKRWVKDLLIAMGIASVIFLFIGLNNVIESDMEKHIEKVSSECASQGYGITAKYTKEGDKYYVCNK